VVAVTSLDPRDGQSSFAAGLARATSQLGLRTILIDGNLRMPATAMHAGLAAPRASWVDVLRGTARLSQSMQKDPRSPMLFMAGTAGGADPRAIWSSAAAAKLMAHLRRVSDIVIVDAVAIAPGGELPLIAGLSDALVVVTAARPGLEAALEHLKSTTTAPAGLVVAR
jgi:Mrp family chromosome partitioning ATPase